MKKKYSLIAALMLGSVAFAQQKPTVLQGKFTGYSQGDMLFLNYINGKDRVVDTIQFENDGSFKLQTQVNSPVLAQLVAGKDVRSAQRAGVLSLYLAPGKVQIAQADSLRRDTPVKGGKVNKEFTELNNQYRAIAHIAEDINKSYMEASDEQRSSEEFMQSLQDRQNEYFAQRKEIAKNFIEKHPKSFVGFDQLNEVLGYTPEAADMEEYFNKFDKSIQQSEKGQVFQQAINKAKATAIGSIAPEFSQEDVDGNMVSLSDFRGKFVLIDFWASWCGPCRHENPNVVKAFHALKDKNFTVLGVSLDQPGKRDAWLQAIEHDKLEWTQVSDLKFWENEVAVLYNVRSIPQNFLLDPEGRIVAKNLRGEDLEEKLLKYINAETTSEE